MRIQLVLGFLLIGTVSCLTFAKNSKTDESPIALPRATDLIIRPDRIFDPYHISLDSMQTYEKIFTFDWNNCASIEPNKKKVDEIEIFLKTTKPEQYAKLNEVDKQAFGKILYKLGTFYAHIDHSFELAIERMNLADTFLRDKHDKAWNYNHLAYAYEQKYAKQGLDEDKVKALSYSNKVIMDIFHEGKNKEVAFAYCVKGLIENDMIMAQLAEAETSFKNALEIYESLPNGKDDQYARAKNKLASIILAMNRDDEAIEMFEQLRNYWVTKKDMPQNPYAAINFISLGRAYLKVGKAKDARDELQKAINIYLNIYGNDSQMLKQPYHLLSEAYKILGDQKLADSYEQKAIELK